MTAFLAGFAMSLSLIVAIGAQNAFVLRQGLRRSHVGAVVATCVISEAILITLGVAGFGALTRTFPSIEMITRWGGAAFLVIYGILSLRRAFFETEKLVASNGTEMTVSATVLTCLALTWLNPHAILDTVVLLGAIAAHYDSDRWVFGAGALLASTFFFVSLGYGAALLQPIFARPIAWRILEVCVAILVWSIAAALILA